MGTALSKMFFAVSMLHAVVNASSKIDKVEKHESSLATTAVTSSPLIKKTGMASLFIAFSLFPGVSNEINPRIYRTENEYVIDIRNI